MPLEITSLAKRARRLTCILLVSIYPVIGGAAHAGEGQGWGPFSLLGHDIAPGTRQKFSFTTAHDFESAFIDSPVFVARGAAPGPTLCVTAVIHGDEINSAEIARRAFSSVDPEALQGTLVVLPMVNALGFRTMDRYMPDRRDLNRYFPGSETGSVASIVANAVFDKVVRRCDRLIDLHTGSNYRTNMAQIRVDTESAESFAMATHFGAGIIVAGEGPDGSLRREAVKAGVPAIIYESGPPYLFVPQEIETGTRGVLNVMDHLGMYESIDQFPPAKLLARSYWVRVPMGQGGIYLPVVRLGDRVKVGDLLATVTDPLSDEVHEIRADGEGIVVGGALPQVVLSGYGLLHIGEIKEE